MRHTDPRFMWFQTVQSSAALFGAIGLAIGILIGLAIGNGGAGAGIGLIGGAVLGLVIGLRLARGVDRDFDTRPAPPPGGWRRWNDDDEWDS